MKLILILKMAGSFKMKELVQVMDDFRECVEINPSQVCLGLDNKLVINQREFFVENF